jgi:hypothetical protein
MSGRGLPVTGRIEHAANVSAGDGAAVHAEADKATRELVHDHEHPVAPERDRLAAQAVHAPEAVSGVAVERQPRWARSALSSASAALSTDGRVGFATGVVVQMVDLAKLARDKRRQPARTSNRWSSVDAC